MTRTGRPLVGALSLAALFLVSTPALHAQAPMGGDGGPQGRWWANPRVAERLDLSDAQIEQIDAIAFETGEAMIDARARFEKAQLAMKRLLETDAPDTSSVERAIGELEAAQCEIARLEVRSRTRIALVLDREQRAALMERHDQFERMRRRRAPMDRRRFEGERRPGS